MLEFSPLQFAFSPRRSGGALQSWAIQPQ